MQDKFGAAACGEVSMFESIKTDRQLNALQYLTSLSISLVAHAAVLGVLVVLPLTFFNVLHADEFVDILIAPPSAPVAPPPPAAPSTNRPSAGPEIFKGKIGETPGCIPDGIRPEIEPPDTTGIERIIPGISNLDQGEVRKSIIGEILKLKDPVVVGPPQPPIRRTPVRVSGTIQEGKLLHRVDPVYPKLAIQARVSGSVKLEATIDEEGSVTDLKILEGHPLLNEAAYNAVKQWKYMPTLIGGEPVPVLANVTVIFRIR
jgi:periplasmic protein TonB